METKCRRRLQRLISNWLQGEIKLTASAHLFVGQMERRRGNSAGLIYRAEFTTDAELLNSKWTDFDCCYVNDQGLMKRTILYVLILLQHWFNIIIYFTTLNTVCFADTQKWINIWALPIPQSTLSKVMGPGGYWAQVNAKPGRRPGGHWSRWILTQSDMASWAALSASNAAIFSYGPDILIWKWLRRKNLENYTLLCVLLAILIAQSLCKAPSNSIFKPIYSPRTSRTL